MASSPYYSSAGYYSEPATYAQSYDPSYYPQAPAVSLPANTGHGAPQDYPGSFTMPAPHMMSGPPPPVYNNWGPAGYGTNAVNDSYAHPRPPPPHSQHSPASSFSSTSSDASGFLYGAPGQMGYHHSSDPQGFAHPPPITTAGPAMSGYQTGSSPLTAYDTQSSEDASAGPIETVPLVHVPSGHHCHQITSSSKEGVGHRLWNKLSHITDATVKFRHND